jgi:hypothetical protein
MRTIAGNSEVGRLMEFLNRLGQDVKITVKPTRKRVGEMEVVCREGLATRSSATAKFRYDMRFDFEFAKFRL